MKFSQILEEFYRRQVHVVKRYNPGNVIDWEGTTFENANLQVSDNDNDVIAVEDDGTLVVESASTIDAGENITAEDLGDGYVGIDAVDPVAESGTVLAGDTGVLGRPTNLADGETINVRDARFMAKDGTALPTGCDLVILSFDGAGNYTVETTILSGDGSTVYDDAEGDPLASYTNSTGSPQTVGFAVDNTASSDVEAIVSMTTTEA